MHFHLSYCVPSQYCGKSTWLLIIDKPMSRGWLSWNSMCKTMVIKTHCCWAEWRNFIPSLVWMLASDWLRNFKDRHVFHVWRNQGDIFYVWLHNGTHTHLCLDQEIPPLWHISRCLLLFGESYFISFGDLLHKSKSHMGWRHWCIIRPRNGCFNVKFLPSNLHAHGTFMSKYVCNLFDVAVRFHDGDHFNMVEWWQAWTSGEFMSIGLLRAHRSKKSIKLIQRCISRTCSWKYDLNVLVS